MTDMAVLHISMESINQKDYIPTLQEFEISMDLYALIQWGKLTFQVELEISRKHSPKIELSAREATAFKRLILWSATVNFPSEPFKTAKMDLSRVKIASESEHFKAKDATHFTADSRVESSLACSCVAKGLARSPTYPLKSIDKETKMRLKKNKIWYKHWVL